MTCRRGCSNCHDRRMADELTALADNELTTTPDRLTSGSATRAAAVVDTVECRTSSPDQRKIPPIYTHEGAVIISVVKALDNGHAPSVYIGSIPTISHSHESATGGVMKGIQSNC